MNRSFALAFTLAALATAFGRAAAGDDLLARMTAVNPSLHSYTATLRASVAMKSFPFLNADLVGTLYHQEPDKTKVVFTSGVPMVAQQFDKLYAHIESPSNWHNVYQVAVAGDDGATTTFRLTPRKSGNVDHVDARVNDKSALVESMRWTYKNGGYAEMANRYGSVGGDTLVTSQRGHVEEPGYTADITASIGNYTINPSLSDSVFTAQ